MWRPPLCRACASLTFASLGLELGEVLPGGQPHLHLVPVEHLARQELQELVHRVLRGNHHLCVPVGKPRGWAERTLVARIPSSLSRAVWESLLYHPQAGKASSAPSAQWMLGAGGGPGSSALVLPQLSPFGLAVGSVLCELQLHHVVDADGADGLDQLLVSCPLRGGERCWGHLLVSPQLTQVQDTLGTDTLRAPAWGSQSTSSLEQALGTASRGLDETEHSRAVHQGEGDSSTQPQEGRAKQAQQPAHCGHWSLASGWI